MSELTEMLNRCELKNIISFIISGVTDNEPEDYGANQDIIKKSFDSLLDKLEKMFPAANRDNDEFFSIISEFSSVQQRTYLEMGVLIGLQLYRTLNTTLEINSKSDKITKKTPEKELLEILANARIDNAIEDRLKSTPEYMTARKRQRDLHDNIKKSIGLTENQKVAVDDVVSATNLTGAEYGRVAYNMGLQDGIKLVSELK